MAKILSVKIELFKKGALKTKLCHVLDAIGFRFPHMINVGAPLNVLMLYDMLVWKV